MNVTSAQLRRAANIKEKIDALEKELEAVLGLPAGAEADQGMGASPKRRIVSAAARAKMRKAQQARWARHRGAMPPAARSSGKRRMSPAVKAKLSAIAKARWRSAKAQGKSAL